MDSLFPKQNFNYLSPSFHIHVSLSDLYIPRIGLPSLLQPNRQTDPGKYINRSQIHEGRNWERGRTVSFLGIHKSDFQYSAPFQRHSIAAASITAFSVGTGLFRDP